MAVATGTLALAQHRAGQGPPPTRRRSRPAPTCGWTWPPRGPPAPRRRSARCPGSRRDGGRRRHGERCPPRSSPSTPRRPRRSYGCAPTRRRCRRPRCSAIAPAAGTGGATIRGAAGHSPDRHAQPRAARARSRRCSRSPTRRRHLPAPAVGRAADRRPPARALRLARRDSRRLPAPPHPGRPQLHAAGETAELARQAHHRGATTSSWTAAANSGELDSQANSSPVPLNFADPDTAGWQSAPGGATLTFDPGYGVVYNQLGPSWSPRR